MLRKHEKNMWVFCSSKNLFENYDFLECRTVFWANKTGFLCISKLFGTYAQTD